MAKRNAKGVGTIRERSDGRWEGIYTVGRDPKTGKQVRRSVYGKTQQEVVKKLNQVQNDINTGVYTEPLKLTVGAWLDIWLKEYTGNVKESTHREYEGVINYRIKPYFGKIKLSELKPPQVQAFYNDCLRGLNDKKALSSGTVSFIHIVLKSALKQAVKIGYLRSNPADSCKLPKVERREMKPLDDDNIKAFLKIIVGHRYETLYTICLFTGIRQGEALGLSWDAVNFKNGTICIKQQLQRIKGEYKILSVKNDKPRTITLAPSVMRLLERQKRQQSIWKLQAGEAWNNSMNLVFTNEIGMHLIINTVYKDYKRIVEKLGFDISRFHELRHIYAVISLRSGDDVKTLQENLGHSSAAFTLDVYGHVTEQMKRDSANRMERFIGSVTASF